MRLGAQPFLWKWVLFAWEWKMISISKADRLPSLWNRDPGELRNGLLNKPSENETVGTGFGAPLSPSPCTVFRITLFKMHNCDTTALLSESLERRVLVCSCVVLIRKFDTPMREANAALYSCLLETARTQNHSSFQEFCSCLKPETALNVSSK